MTEMEQILSHAAPWLHRYGYLALALCVMFEGVGIPLPGTIMTGGAALLAAKGELNIAAVCLVAWFAAMGGDNLGYLLGRSGGRRLLLRAGINRQRLSRLEGFFRRFGIWLILCGRFFDGTRQLDGLVAGGASMPWRRFLAADVAGTALWVSLWAIGPYTLDEHAALLRDVLAYLNPWVAAIAVLALGIVIYLFIRRSTQNRVLHVSETALAAPAVELRQEAIHKRHLPKGGSS